MSVTAGKEELREALERAVRLADRGRASSLWEGRTEHVGDSPSQTMVAFLGNALLARATLGERVDPRSIKARSGERGYSARGTISVLVAGKRAFGYGLGVERAEPLNNQPFFHADRIEDIATEEVKANARPYLRALKGYVREIDSMSQAEAAEALAGFISVRRRLAEEQRREAAARLTEEPLSLPRLARALASFVGERPEGGRRGQALAAAALDRALPRVELGAIHDPDAIDVAAFRSADDPVAAFVVQVKQKAVGEDVAIELAEAALAEGAPVALLLAIDPSQAELDEEAIARRVEALGVIVVVATSVASLLRSLAAYSALEPNDVAAALPRAFEDRMREIGCEPDALQHWRELVEELRRS